MNLRDVLEATTQCKHNAKSNGCLRWKSRPETEILGDGLEKRLSFHFGRQRSKAWDFYETQGVFAPDFLHRQEVEKRERKPGKNFPDVAFGISPHGQQSCTVRGKATASIVTI